LILPDIVREFSDCDRRLERTSINSKARNLNAALAGVSDQITSGLRIAPVTEPHLMHSALSTAALLRSQIKLPPTDSRQRMAAGLLGA
jgi:hypothetical protein